MARQVGQDYRPMSKNQFDEMGQSRKHGPASTLFLRWERPKHQLKGRILQLAGQVSLVKRCKRAQLIPQLAPQVFGPLVASAASFAWRPADIAPDRYQLRLCPLPALFV